MLENKHIVVVGGGHAGIEAAAAVAHQKIKVTIITLDKRALGRLSCNPSIGGLAKSHLVHEIDALGGVMGWAADRAGIQFKTLNKTKGRAVWAHRVQVDKKKYPEIIQAFFNKNDFVDIVEDEVLSLIIKGGSVSGVKTKKNKNIPCSAVVVTCGTFLNGLIHIGNKNYRAGRLGEKGSYGLTENLISLGLKSGRLKTGTPPRINKKSIDFSCAELAPGDSSFIPFSLDFKKNKKNLVDCFLVRTNKKCHSVINKDINKSAMFSGKIKGVGPRYCPSIEDKVFRFSQRPSHHLFLEPEWFDSNQFYISGFSTSLPKKTQLEALKKIKALRNVEFIRPGYAIEYDFFPPRQLKATLESKKISGLFLAGQMNGTSGYEEAAAQGLLAGINASFYSLKKDFFVLSRTESYIGVMVDDLITSHLDEPYRMFTSRCEHRLFLRPDNCYSRLHKKAVDFGLIDKKTTNTQKKYLSFVEDLSRLVSSQKTKKEGSSLLLSKIIKRPKERLEKYIRNKKDLKNPLFVRALFEVETSIKYEGYIENEKQRIEKNKLLDGLKIPRLFDFSLVAGLSNESIERLSLVCPETLGQASRIYGIRPTDITVLGLFIKGGVSRETIK